MSDQAMRTTPNNTPQTRIAACVVVALTIAAGMALLSGCAHKGIRLLVVNSSGKPLQKMTIDYAGGSRSFERLEPGKSYATHIQLSQPSSLDVHFDLPGGERKAEKVRAQLEPGYHGDVRLEVSPEGRIGWQKELVRDGSRRPKGTFAPPKQPEGQQSPSPK